MLDGKGRDGKAREVESWEREVMRRVMAERATLAVSGAMALLLAAAGMHPLVVFPFWLLLAAVLLLRAPPRGRERGPVAEVAGPPALSAAPQLALLNALDVPVLVVAADETVLFQNGAAEKAFGTIPAETYLAARIRSPGILDMVRETIATGRANQIEHSERLPSEAVYTVRVARADLPGLLPDHLFLISYRDISHERRIDRMRSDFVANASHELRTPLASLRGFIETLQGPARRDTAAQERFLGIMHEQVNRMSRLVDDLLSLSRLELKSHIAPDERVDLGPLIGRVIDTITPLAEELDVEILFDPPREPALVQGDRDELIEVFENLIENACKYGQEGKRVEVAIGGGQGRPVDVSVRDHGPGIPAEHVPRITERFYRVNVEASRSKKGTGLGLAIVKHILTRHRARLIIRSEVGNGTTFVVRF
ncbi:phosphate regulon sensor histidine kinase PhoR [Ensifer soli]|uniref:phosphate regulon sensor histidine kinase PhoR n=1 Tax=Ciceribacter sp. sgz301302 TaxID=3342379 RepID=UPI0035B78C7D